MSSGRNSFVTQGPKAIAETIAGSSHGLACPASDRERLRVVLLFLDPIRRSCRCPSGTEVGARHLAFVLSCSCERVRPVLPFYGAFVTFPTMRGIAAGLSGTESVEANIGTSAHWQVPYRIA